jgi:hypothetical protein
MGLDSDAGVQTHGLCVGRNSLVYSAECLVITMWCNRAIAYYALHDYADLVARVERSVTRGGTETSQRKAPHSASSMRATCFIIIPFIFHRRLIKNYFTLFRDWIRRRLEASFSNDALRIG